jgi:hypothetical protein
VETPTTKPSDEELKKEFMERAVTEARRAAVQKASLSLAHQNFPGHKYGHGTLFVSEGEVGGQTVRFFRGAPLTKEPEDLPDLGIGDFEKVDMEVEVRGTADLADIVWLLTKKYKASGELGRDLTKIRRLFQSFKRKYFGKATYAEETGKVRVTAWTPTS